MQDTCSPLSVFSVSRVFEKAAPPSIRSRETSLQNGRQKAGRQIERERERGGTNAKIRWKATHQFDREWKAKRECDSIDVGVRVRQRGKRTVVDASAPKYLKRKTGREEYEKRKRKKRKEEKNESALFHEERSLSRGVSPIRTRSTTSNCEPAYFLSAVRSLSFPPRAASRWMIVVKKGAEPPRCRGFVKAFSAMLDGRTSIGTITNALYRSSRGCVQDTERIVARKGSNVCRNETIWQTHAQNKKREGQQDAIGRHVGRKRLVYRPADWRVL